AVLGEVLARREPRRGAQAAQHLDDVTLGVVDEDRHFAAKAERAAVSHAQRQDGCRGRVGRVATALEQGESRLDGALPAGADGAILAGGLPGALFRGFLRLVLGGSRGRCREDQRYNGDAPWGDESV